MDADAWIATFDRIAQDVQRAVQPHLAHDQKVLGQGAGGDDTYPLDRAAEDAAIDVLQGVGPLRLVTEERGVVEIGDGQPSVTVAMDPVDGSHNAKVGIPLYSISLAVAPVDATLGNVQAGLVRNLATGQTYRAVRGRGAFTDGREIRASHATEDWTAAFELWPPYKVEQTDPRFWSRVTKVMQSARRTRSLGSTALDLALVAAGAVDVFVDVRGVGRSLDASAAVRIVEEAGGVVTDDEGDPVTDVPVDIGATTNLVAAGNEILHQQVLELIP